MKTIIYNQSTQQFHSGIYPNDYLNADGQLSPVHTPLIKLEAITSDPVYNPQTEIATMQWQININPQPHHPLQANGTATQQWTIRDKTPAELARDTWHHIYPMRIIAPVQMLFDDMGSKFFSWFSFQKLPVEKHHASEALACLYCNEIDTSHLDFVNALKAQGIITTETYPED